jgi:hypothetical protein
MSARRAKAIAARGAPSEPLSAAGAGRAAGFWQLEHALAFGSIAEYLVCGLVIPKSDLLRVGRRCDADWVKRSVSKMGSSVNAQHIKPD